MIQAKVIADSINQFGNRITTMVVTFPRYILAELNTHRMFSRNSASSRAIPFAKMLESVKTNPFIPIAYQQDHKGMQGTKYFTEQQQEELLDYVWLKGRDRAVQSAEELAYGIGVKSIEEGVPDFNIEVTKQLVNRLLEAYMLHTVIITATEFENFFALRCPKYVLDGNERQGEYRSRKQIIQECGDEDEFAYFEGLQELDWLKINKGQADIHMMALAEAMYDAYNESTPNQLEPGQWHVPFGDNLTDELLKDTISWANGEGHEQLDQIKIKIAVARCARVSYTVVGEEDKPADYEADIKLHDRLAVSGHFSPFEHIGRAMTDQEFKHHISGVCESKLDGSQLKVPKDSQGWSGNLRGWCQYRKMLPNENITK